MLQLLFRMFQIARGAAKPTPRWKRRNARATIAVAVFGFCGFNAILSILSERNLAIRDPFYGDKLTKLRAKLRQPDREAFVLMMGSSRTGFAFHGLVVEEQVRKAGRSIATFNFGVPATGPVTHLLYARRLIEAGVKPDLMLIEILPAMFADVPEKAREQAWLYGDRLRGDELAIVERYGFDSVRVRSRWRESIYTPWYGLRFQLIGRVMQSWIPWQLRYDWSRGTDECGWCTPYRDQLTEDERATALGQARQEYFATLQDWRLGEHPRNALKELLELARQHGIATQLVLLPEGSTFRSWYSPTVQERLADFLSSTGCEVVDARLWLDDLDFTDDHHQLKSGAIKFSQRIADDVLIPWLNRK